MVLLLLLLLLLLLEKGFTCEFEGGLQLTREIVDTPCARDQHIIN